MSRPGGERAMSIFYIETIKHGLAAENIKTNDQ
jgi:hypothetical protein